ncbi:hypothetical protein [Priestia megaterium]|uniref:hypothetical protein n=1 Tax=Priestia megaterium TaxID=1404 RepID=UPI003CEF0712
MIDLNKWVGKVKGYDHLGYYMGTYQAVIEKQGNLLYKMTLSFDGIYMLKQQKRKFHLKDNIFYSSSLEVLKRKFRSLIPLEKKTKVIWMEKIIEL